MQWQGTFDPFTAGADPGSFLGGGAPLRNGITNTNKPHFCAEYQLYYKAVGHLRGGGGGGAHPQHHPRSAPVLLISA